MIKAVSTHNPGPLTHYLLLRRPGGFDQLLRFLELLDLGGDTATNFRTAFQTDFDTLSRELDLYVRNSVTLPAIDYPLEVRLEDAGRWNAEDISEAEANYHLGELLFRVNRVDDARVYLEAAMDQAPNMVEPVTGMGVLYEMEGDVDTAFEYFERAAEMEAAGYLPRLLYAQRLLFRNGYSDPEEVETATEHLRRAVALRPESVESLQRLGEVLLSDPETIDEALDVLSRAVRLDRGNPSLALSYLRALWRSGQTESAREGTEALAGATTDPEVRREAEALLDDIERFGDPTRFTATGDITPQPEVRPNLARSDNVSGAGADAELVLPGNASIVPEGMEQVSGRLTLMDCSGDGVRFRVDTEEQTLWFAATDSEAVSFVSFSSETRDLDRLRRVLASSRGANYLRSGVRGRGLSGKSGRCRVSFGIDREVFCGKSGPDLPTPASGARRSGRAFPWTPSGAAACWAASLPLSWIHGKARQALVR